VVSRSERGEGYSAASADRAQAILVHLEQLVRRAPPGRRCAARGLAATCTARITGPRGVGLAIEQE